MCGIAGIVGNENNTEAVSRMVQCMRHRGPDDSGVDGILAGERAVTLGNTRLAIIDLSPAGHMPMADPDTGNWITYNGEVYNFQELRRELEPLGRRFWSNSDTEVILAAYARWGRACVSRFRGMFAFAIWDATLRELFLARDRVGKKPLYYWQASDGRFLFSSEVRSLLASGLIDRHLDPDALEVFLFNGFMVAPRTMIKDVHSLLPGQWMRVSLDGQIVQTQSYWRLPSASTTKRDASDMKAELRDRLEEAVRLRLISDVPLGAFLSGGLDSSTLVALMAHAGGDIRTFSITFDEAAYDESPFSNQVARQFATAHTEVRLHRQEFEVWLPDALAALDQPTFDGLNTYYVARAARASGLTVALTGTGGDEIFGGYDFFRSVPWLVRAAQMARAIPAPLARSLQDRLGRPPFRVAGPWKLLELLHEPGRRPSDDAWAAAYQTAQLLFPAWVRARLLSPSSRDASKTWFGLPIQFIESLRETCGDDGMDQLSHLASSLFLGERCLRDIDTMSMGVSLEVRAPFTDHLFLESAWQVPGPVRCQGAPNKPFEWALARSCLGDQYPYRKKQGFIFPFEEWLRNPVFLERMRVTLSDARLASQIGLRPEAVQEIVQGFSGSGPRVPWSRIWSLFVLLQWCERHQVSLK